MMTKKILKKEPVKKTAIVDKPNILNRTFSEIFIYPEKDENFVGFAINFPFSKKSSFSENQLKSKKVQSLIKSKLIEESSQEDLEIFLKTIGDQYKKNPTDPIGKSYDLLAESGCVGGLSDYFASIEEFSNKDGAITKSDNKKAFEDLFFKKVKEKNESNLLADIKTTGKENKPEIKIVDILLTTVEDKIKQLIEAGVFEIKTNLLAETTNLIDEKLTLDNFIKSISESVYKEKFEKALSLVDSIKD